MPSRFLVPIVEFSLMSEDGIPKKGTTRQLFHDDTVVLSSGETAEFRMENLGGKEWSLTGKDFHKTPDYNCPSNESDKVPLRQRKCVSWKDLESEEHSFELKVQSTDAAPVNYYIGVTVRKPDIRKRLEVPVCQFIPDAMCFLYSFRQEEVECEFECQPTFTWAIARE